MAAKYTFRAGARIRGVDPGEAAAELARIRAEQALTPAAVVAAAGAADSPIHAAFEWDNDAAAHEHRLAQARQLIRAVCVVREEGRAPEPMFVHIAHEEQPQYEDTVVVVKSQTLLDLALAELRAKLVAAQKSVTVMVDIARRENDPDALSRASRVAGHIGEANKAVAPDEPQV